MRRQRLALITMAAIGSVCLTAQGRTAVVAGFVRYASGAAIENVRVSLIVPENPIARTTRTGADGSYRFDEVPAGEYRISASYAGAVAKKITVTTGSTSTGIDFSIRDGSARLVAGRVVMNGASVKQQIPIRIAAGVMRRDGTLVVPLPPGDHRLVARIPQEYFVDSVTYGSATVYSLQRVGGRRLSAAAFAITIPAEPDPIPELVVVIVSR